MLICPRPPWLKTLEPHQLARWIEAARRGECGPPLSAEARTRLGTLLYPADEEGERLLDDPFSDEARIEWRPEWRPVPFARYLPAPVAELPWDFEQLRFPERVARWDPDEHMDLGPNDVWLHGPYGDWDDCRCFDEPARPDALAWEESEGASVLVIDEVMRVFPTHAEWDEHSPPDELLEAFRDMTGWLLYDEALGRVLFEPLRCLDCAHVFEFGYTCSARPRAVEPPACPRCGGGALALAHDPEPTTQRPVRLEQLLAG